MFMSSACVKHWVQRVHDRNSPRCRLSADCTTRGNQRCFQPGTRLIILFVTQFSL
jgi:hypothetical protein